MDQEQYYSTTSLFVGDLAQFCSENDLSDLFSKHGELAEVRIMRNNTTKKPLCYGFVTFVEAESAKSALESLNGASFQGRKLRIGWAAHNFQVRKAEEAVVNSLYVRFSSPQLQTLVTEEILHHVFDTYKNVIDISIKKVVCEETENTQSGYGFVHFAPNEAGIASALEALSAVNNTTLDEVTYSVEASKNLLKQLKEDPPAPPATAPHPQAQPQQQQGKVAAGHVRQKSGEVIPAPVGGKGVNPSHSRSRSRSDLATSLNLNLNLTPSTGPQHGGGSVPKPGSGPPARYPPGAGNGAGPGPSPRTAMSGAAGAGGGGGAGTHHSPRFGGGGKPGGIHGSSLAQGASMMSPRSASHPHVHPQPLPGQMQGRQFPKHHQPSQGATGGYSHYGASSTSHGRPASVPTHDPYAVPQAPLKGAPYPVGNLKGTGTTYGAQQGPPFGSARLSGATTSQGPPGKQQFLPSRPVHQLTGHHTNHSNVPSASHQPKGGAGSRQGPDALPIYAHHGLAQPMKTPAQLGFHQSPQSAPGLQYDAGHPPPLSPSRLNLPAHSIPAPIQTTGFGPYMTGYGDLQTRRSTPGSNHSAHSLSHSSHAASPYSTASSPSLATHAGGPHGGLSARYSPRADGQPYVPRDLVLQEHGLLTPAEDPHVALRASLSLAHDDEFSSVTTRASFVGPTLTESLGAIGAAQGSVSQRQEATLEPEARGLVSEGFSRPPVSYHPPSRPQPLELSYLNINRSGSSDGMQAPPRSATTHATTDSEGGFFGSASSSFVTETTSVFAPSSSFLSHASFNGVPVPTTPSVVAVPTLFAHKEGSAESSSVGSSGYDLGPRLTRRALERGMCRKTSSSASLQSDAEAELIDDEYTYSGSNSQSDVMAAYERQLSRGISGIGSENNSFYGAFPTMDTTFLETPSSSAHSLQSQALVSRSGSSDQSVTRLAGTWLQSSSTSSKQQSPQEKQEVQEMQGRCLSGGLSEADSSVCDAGGVAMVGVSPSPSTGTLNTRAESSLAPPDTGCTTASCSTGSSAGSVALVRGSRQPALTEFFKPVRQSAYTGPKSPFF